MSDDQTKTPPPVVPQGKVTNTPPPPPSDVPPVPPSTVPASAPQPQPAPASEDKPTSEELAEAEARARALLGQSGDQSPAPTNAGGRAKKIIVGVLAFLVLGGGLVAGVGQVQQQLLLQSLAKDACGPGDVQISGKSMMVCKEVDGEWKWRGAPLDEEAWQKLKQQANQAGGGTVHFQGNEQQLENLKETGDPNNGKSEADCDAAGLPYCSGCGGFCGNASTGCNTLSVERCGEYHYAGTFEGSSDPNLSYNVYYCAGVYPGSSEGGALGTQGCSGTDALPSGVRFDPATGQIIGSFCGTIQVDVPGKGFVSRTDSSGCKQPLRQPTVPSAPALVCSGLSKSPVTPTVGSEVTLTCSAAGSPINHYEFQYSVNGGAFSNLTPVSAGSNQAKFNVTQAGDYVARCRVCKTTDSSQCTAYQTL